MRDLCAQKLTCLVQKGMDNVSTVVDYKADGNNQICTRDYIDSQAPEVHKSANINLKEKEYHK